MSPTWYSGDLPERRALGLWDWARVAVRGVLIALVFAIGTVITLSLRAIEIAMLTSRRPLTSRSVQAVCRVTLFLLRLPLCIEGASVTRAGPTAFVANHASWLDILVLHAAQPVVFVSKSEVSEWPVIGFLARLAGTLFITRAPRDATAQRRQLAAALQDGQRLLMFPEATSTDGLRVLPFKSTLMSAFFADDMLPDMQVQPLSVIYDAPAQQDPRFYGWWGDMDLGSHLLHVLAQAPQGRITLCRHAPLRVAQTTDRKDLAARLERAVRSGMPPARQHNA